MRATDGGVRLGALHVRVLGINDLHGHLDPTEVDGRRAGGVAWLSSWLDRRSAAVPSIRVTAGDSRVRHR